MPRARRNVFTTVKSEGALLPPDFLQQLAEGRKDVDGLTPEAYHLAGGETLKEAASRSWNRLLGAWAAFQAASKDLKDSDAGTGITREKWLLPLFQELGYGRLLAAKTLEVEGKPYPISHFWQHAPIHLVGRNVELDTRSPGVAGAAKTTPHGLVQEFLNRSEDSVWGFVSNGMKLRILRDNRSLTRQAYVEFDLAGMMDGQVYADFALLWLVCHQSRIEADKAEQCWLEKWSEAARDQGTRAMDQLREGVQDAIQALGKGFLAHRANKELLEKLRKGALDKQDYYRQLLRVVYRLIFLCVAEDRDLLLTAAKGSKQRDRYQRYYSMDRLRTLAERRRGTAHGDLWQGLNLVFKKLSGDTGEKELGLPALGSFLWSQKATPDLDQQEIANVDLLQAIRSLAFTRDQGIRRAIDFKNLGAEELGSVYESLLELHPDLNADAPTFDLKTAAGHERKTTGSYYTPTSLIECLLDSALDPVLDEAVKSKEPEKAILDLKVCDPACGSGHFLIAAAHRMANKLAATRTGDEEPSPEAVRKALRDIVGRCLYGVDINPMAVELCKVNLWLEALEPGKSLSFLEHHIQCGNSLLGATPSLLKKGIPDEALEPLEGDDKAICRIFKRKNKAEREHKQGSLLEDMAQPWERLGDLATALAELDAIPDDTPEGQRAKQERWEQLVRSNSYESGRLWADAWCAAFVWKKVDDPKLPYPITEEVFRRIEKNPSSAPDWMRAEIRRLAEEYRFFQWHLGFPDVFRVPAAGESSPERPGWVGGFDVVLGNPPWDQLQFDDREFFGRRRPDIANASTMTRRKGLIADLREEDPTLFELYTHLVRFLDGVKGFVHSSRRYPLTSYGRLNLAPLFAELARSILAPWSRAGLIVPSGIAFDSFNQFFFRDLVERGSLRALYEFENEGFFAGAGQGHMNRFCLLTLSGLESAASQGEFLFQGKQVDELSDPDRRIRLSMEDFRLLNPNTRTCPIFRTRRDADLTKAIYRRVPILAGEKGGGNGGHWGFSGLLMFMMNTDSIHFKTALELEAAGWTLRDTIFHLASERYLPLYEAKMVYQFNHRHGSHGEGGGGERAHVLPEVPLEKLADPCYRVRPHYWVPEAEVNARLGGRWNLGWLLGWRDVTDARASARTVIASVIPRVGVGNQYPVMFFHRPELGGHLAANLSSFVLDFVARQKVGGTHLNFFIYEQLPLLPPETYDQPATWAKSMSVAEWIRPRVLELAYTAWDLQPFARDLGYDGPPFRWDPARRFQLRCELDAAFFHLYGVSGDDANYIMDTFPIVRAADEKKYGDYRTKRQILDIFLRLQTAVGGTGSESRAATDVPIERGVET